MYFERIEISVNVLKLRLFVFKKCDNNGYIKNKKMFSEKDGESDVRK